MLQKQEIKSGLVQFYGSENFYRHSMLRDYVYTDGIKYLADSCESYWLIDAILSWQLEKRVREQEFQRWILKRTISSNFSKQKSFLLSLSDGNGNDIVVQDAELNLPQVIEYSDFPLDEIELWLENNTLYLLSER